MQINEESVFLYTVNPRKVITGLSGVNTIRTSKSLFLTKEDVKICLQKATVYRRFANEGINERVNVGNIDRLHRENYVSEKDWDAMQAKEMSEGHGKVEVPVESPDLTKNDAEKEVAAPVVSNIETAQNEDEENKQTRAILDETKADDNEIESDDDDEVTVADVDEKEILKYSDSGVEKKICENYNKNVCKIVSLVSLFVFTETKRNS